MRLLLSSSLFLTLFVLHPLGSSANAADPSISAPKPPIAIYGFMEEAKSLFELADHVLPKEADLNVDAYTAAILMAHDYETDYKNLRRLLTTPVTYIGMLGPRKRTEKMILRANEEGKPFTDSELNRMMSPVGLDTGAATPEEIAVSAIAEIRTHFSGRSGGRLRMRGKPIYES